MKNQKKINMEIYFNDLTEDKQKEVLKFYKLKSEAEGNFDVSPLFILEKS